MRSPTRSGTRTTVVRQLKRTSRRSLPRQPIARSRARTPGPSPRTPAACAGRPSGLPVPRQEPVHRVQERVAAPRRTSRGRSVRRSPARRRGCPLAMASAAFTVHVRSCRPARTSTGWRDLTQAVLHLDPAVARGRRTSGGRRARTLPAVFRAYSSIRGSSGSAKWNGHCSSQERREAPRGVRTDDSFSHDAATCARRCSGSNAARFFSTSARYFADGTPPTTIVCAAIRGSPPRSAARRTRRTSDPARRSRSSPIDRASDTTSSAIVSERPGPSGRSAATGPMPAGPPGSAGSRGRPAGPGSRRTRDGPCPGRRAAPRCGYAVRVADLHHIQLRRNDIDQPAGPPVRVRLRHRPCRLRRRRAPRVAARQRDPGSADAVGPVHRAPAPR